MQRLHRPSPAAAATILAMALCVPVSSRLVSQQRADVPRPPGTASIAGRVVVIVDGQPQPIRRATVLVRSDQAELEQTQADTDGRFLVRGLRAGRVSVLAERAGFVTVSRDHDRSVSIDLAEGEARQIDIRMVRGAALEGRVTTPAGAPAINLVVTAARVGYGLTGRRPVSVTQAITDDLGRFRLHTLPAGRFFVSAAPDPVDQASRSSLAADPTRGLARAYYPGTPHLDQARAVDVSSGQEIAGLDFAVSTVPLTSVEAAVTDGAGRPPRTFSARLLPVGGIAGDVRGFIAPNRNLVRFPAVPPGDYWMLTTVAPTGGGPYEFAAPRISIAEGVKPSLAIATAPGIRVTGRVTSFDAAAPIPRGLEIVAEETAWEMPIRPDMGPTIGVAPVSADGTFAFASLFGPRLFRVARLPAGWALVTVTRDSRDVTDGATDFIAGDTPASVTLVVTARTGSVSGRVTDAAGGPAAGTRVVVFPEDPSQHRAGSRTIRTGRTGPDGAYAIDGLLPGRYLAVAADDLAPGAWEDPDVLRGLATRAAAIVVAESDRLELPLIVRGP